MKMSREFFEEILQALQNDAYDADERLGKSPEGEQWALVRRFKSAWESSEDGLTYLRDHAEAELRAAEENLERARAKVKEQAEAVEKSKGGIGWSDSWSSGNPL